MLKSCTSKMIITLAVLSVMSFDSFAEQIKEKSCNDLVRVFITMDDAEKTAHLQNSKYISTGKVTVQTQTNGVSENTQGITFKTRGQSSIKAPRKNFAFKIAEKDGKKMVIGTAKGEELLFTSMWQDLGYISNKIGYRFMSYSGLAPHPVEYSELLINGETNGLYLVTKSMKDVATKTLDSPLVIRRRYFGQYEVAVYKASKSEHSEQMLSDRYRQMMDLVDDNRKFFGSSSDFHDQLSQYIDLDQYYSWLATNYLLKNGDYADEVFFYAATKGTKTLDEVKFKILPWDLDDLFKDKMHWQYFHPKNIAAVATGKPERDLIFNYESALDRALMRNEYTKKMYHQKIRKMLDNELSEASIKATIEATRKEITPYLTPEILAASAKDSINEGQAYTKEFILKLLEQREAELLARRQEMIRSLTE